MDLQDLLQAKDFSMAALDYPGSSAASLMSAQKTSSMKRSFEREKGRLAANGALWVIRWRQELITNIEHCVASYNTNKTPFT